MIKIIYFNIAALLVLLTILISAVFRRMTKGRANVSFLIAVSEVFLATVCGTLAIYYDNLGIGYATEKWLFHAGYLLFHTLTAAFYLCYLISLTDTWHKLRHNKLLTGILIAPSVLMLILMIANCFTPIIFYIDSATEVYTRGGAFVFTYLVGAFYLLYGICYIFKHKRLFTLKWIFTLFAPYPLIMAAMIIEFFLPYIVIELFVNSLALLFVANNIQRPEELLDAGTGFGNASTFETTCRKAFINKKPLREILIKIINYGTMRDILGFDEQTRLKESICTGIRRINKSFHLGAGICYAGEGQFCILVEEKAFSGVSTCAAEISAFLNSPLRFGSIEVTPVTTVCVIRIPEDISDFDSLVTFNYNFENRLPTEKVLYTAELFQDNYYKLLLNIDRIIENALVQNRLEVYYQPIYSLTEHRFTCAEALLRLRDEQYGFVAPDIFIPAAEKSGAIYKVGAFVLNEVCAFIASEAFSQLSLDYIEVNLSTTQCMQNNLTEKIRATLANHGVSNEKINLEITETAVAQSPERLSNTLLQLTQAGISISLDDFGSGYSNIHRIACLPVSIVKLDKEFVSNYKSAKTLIILREMISMLKALDMKIVAEGIETIEAAKLFTELECDYIQGYYYARPLPLADFITFLTQHQQAGSFASKFLKSE